MDAGDGTAMETPFQRRVREQSALFEARGIPASASGVDVALLRSRLATAVHEFSAASGIGRLDIRLTSGPEPRGDHAPDVEIIEGRTGTERSRRKEAVQDGLEEFSLEARAARFTSIGPLYSFDFLVAPARVMESLLLAVGVVTVRSKVFDEWGLRNIQPFVGSAINLHGPPGTGKTLAAHAIADHLHKRIVESKYSELESKYQGEGPKNLAALFRAAARDDAVLFLDEADSVMSRRLANISQASEQAINAMRSELLQCLDRFDGLVIFASNFVESYDPAFDSRVRQVLIPAPDEAGRREIWRRHLPPTLPVDPSLNLDTLAAVDEISGREIRRAVVDAAVGAAIDDRAVLRTQDFLKAIEHIKASRIRNADVPRSLLEEESAPHPFDEEVGLPSPREATLPPGLGS
ncbi:MAG: ATP-binding protein [Frankia sp.]